MLITPADFYRPTERFVTSAPQLADWFGQVEAIAEAKNCDVYWRGQSDARWALTSSLARLADAPAVLTNEDLDRAEAELLREAKSWITATVSTPTTDLEWLALMQHHSIPTRMIDFSADKYIATFFANEMSDDIEGRLFAALVPKGEFRFAEDADEEIGSIPFPEIRLWRPRAEISPRLVAQQGVFFLGKLPSTRPSRSVDDPAVDGLRQMNRAETVGMMSLSFDIIHIDTTWREATTSPRCFTARLHIDKASVREQLARTAKRGRLRPASRVDHGTCYPDVEGMLRHSRVLDRVRRSLV